MTEPLMTNSPEGKALLRAAGISSFDPDEAPPVYLPPQDQPRLKNPARQRMGRNNRERGAKAERELVRLFERHGWTVLTQSGPNRRDFMATCACGETHKFSVECKSLTKRWPYVSEVAKGWEQATRQAKEHTPLLVFCLRRQGKATEWRRYTVDGFEELAGWLTPGCTGLPYGRKDVRT